MFHTSDSPKIVFQKRKRVGRGNGSNRGKNSGLGHKGQVKRAGKMPVFFEGGRKSLVRRSPKFKGFKQPEAKQLASIPSSHIAKVYAEGGVLSLATLLEKGAIGSKIKTVRIYKTSDDMLPVSFQNDPAVHLTKGVIALIKA
jgi:large subunit ribosomal protein L15